MTQHSVPVTTDDVPDEILRSIHIDAIAETVFAIISEPGWFINDGEYREHVITTEGDVSRVVDPVHGEFSIATLALEPPHRAVFQWLGGQASAFKDLPDSPDSPDSPGAPATIVEFTIEPDGGGVLLTVREQGFAGLSAVAAERRKRFEENSRGWVEELAVAKTLAETA